MENDEGDMTSITEQRETQKGIDTLAPYKTRGVSALSDTELAIAADIAWGGPNWGGDSQFLAQCRAELSKRGLLAAYDAAHVSKNYTLGGILSEAIVFYGAAFAAAYGAEALLNTPAGVVNAAPAGVIASGGGADALIASSTVMGASYSGIMDAIVTSAVTGAEYVAGVAVTSAVNKAVAPKNDAGVQPPSSKVSATPASSVSLPLTLLALAGAVFFS